MSLKFEPSLDDTADMNEVTFAQMLFGALAVLMFLEARSAGKRRDAPRNPEYADHSPEFHPKLLVRWDDEANDSSASDCERGPVSSIRTERRRSKPLVSSSR